MATHTDDHTVVVPLDCSLSSLNSMRNLKSAAAQRPQRSDIFEKHGLHWLVTVEREESLSNTNNSFNVIVLLYCLSVKMDTKQLQKDFPLYGRMVVDQNSDHQHRVFHGRAGRVCNVIGKKRPAHCVQMGNFILSLQCGRTVTEPYEIDMNNGDDDTPVYYDQHWRGAGGLLLENYHRDFYDDDDKTMQVTVQFLEPPVPLFADDGQGHNSRTLISGWLLLWLLLLLSISLNVYQSQSEEIHRLVWPMLPPQWQQVVLDAPHRAQALFSERIVPMLPPSLQKQWSPLLPLKAQPADDAAEL